MSLESMIENLTNTVKELVTVIGEQNNLLRSTIPNQIQPAGLIGGSTAKTLAQSITYGPVDEPEAPAEVVTMVKAKGTKPKAETTAPAICKADVQSAVTEGVGKVGRQAVLDLLQKYGATNVTTLAESLYGKFMTDIAVMLQKAAA